jgi:predicted MFS family arabinose efflux permease
VSHQGYFAKLAPKKSKNLTKLRKDSEVGWFAVRNTASMPKDGSTPAPLDGGELLRILLAGVLSLTVAIGIGRFAYTPILPVMQERSALSNAAAGALASSNYLGYLFGAILSTFVPAGHAQERGLRASLLLIVATTAAMALTTAFPAWLTLRLLSGFAGAGALVFASSVVLEEVSRRGRKGLSGRFYSGVGLGTALSGLAVMSLNAFVMQGSAWRADWLFLGALAAALVVPCWTRLPGSESAGRSGEPSGPGSEAKTKNTNDPASAGVPLVIVLLCVAYFPEGGGCIITGTFLPAIVEDLPGLEGTGAGLWVLVGLAAAPSTVIWTWIASRLGHPLALLLAYAAQAVGIVLPVISAAWWAAAGSAALFGGTVMGIVALTLTYAREAVGTSKAGPAIGFLTGCTGLARSWVHWPPRRWRGTKRLRTDPRCRLGRVDPRRLSDGGRLAMRCNLNREWKGALS